MTTLTLNAQQTELVKQAKKEFANDKNEIKAISNKVKEDFDILINDLGFEKKTHKEEIKALKKGFALYLKEINAEERAFDEAVAVARL